MNRAGEVWKDKDPHSGVFVVLYPSACGGWRVLWLEGKHAGTLDSVSPNFLWDSGAYWERIA